MVKRLLEARPPDHFKAMPRLCESGGSGFWTSANSKRRIHPIAAALYARDWGRGEGRDGRHPGSRLHVAQGDPSELPWRSAVSLCGLSNADLLSVWRRHQALEDRWTCHQDPWWHPMAMVR